MRFKSIDHLLSTVPEGSGEHQFFLNAFEFLTSLSKPATRVEAFALLSVLEMAVIKLKNGKEINSDAMIGSIEGWGCVFSVCFQDISSDPIWWKGNYPNYMSERVVKNLLPKIEEEIEALPSVLAVKWF